MNFISTDEMNLLRNMEASSTLSSSNSSSLRSSPSLKSFDGEDNSNSFNEPNEPCRDENVDANDIFAENIHLKNTTCDIPPAKKTATQTTVTSIVPTSMQHENDATEQHLDGESISRDDENISIVGSQTKCELTNVGNISPNENTSR